MSTAENAPVLEQGQIVAITQGESGLALSSIEKALRLVEEAKELPELRDIRDQAQALTTVARSRALSRDVQNGAAEVTLRATRRMGEILGEQAKTGARATPKTSLRRGAASPSTQREPTGQAAPPPAPPPTLKQLGIDKNLARRAQALAKMPAAKLEIYVRVQKEHPAGEITVAGALKVAASRNPHAASNVNDGPEKNERFTPRALVQELHEEFHFTRDFAGHPSAPAADVIGKKRIWTREDDCFTKDWTGERGLGNWPFDELVKFVPFAFIKIFTGEGELVVQPMPATRTEQDFWQEFIEPFRADRGGAGAEVRFLDGRTSYGTPQDPEGLDSGSAGFASTVVIFRGPFVRSPRVAARGTIEEVIAGLRLGDDKGMTHLWRQALTLARGGASEGDHRALGDAAPSTVAEPTASLPFLAQALEAYRRGEDLCPGCGTGRPDAKRGWLHEGGKLSICGTCSKAGMVPPDVAALSAAKDAAAALKAKKQHAGELGWAQFLDDVAKLPNVSGQLGKTKGQSCVTVRCDAWPGKPKGWRCTKTWRFPLNDAGLLSRAELQEVQQHARGAHQHREQHRRAPKAKRGGAARKR